MKEIELNHICKIEGHASLDVKIEKGKVISCALEASEGARFFEALVLGKRIEDVQEVVSRICGICSSAHSVAAVNALENAMSMPVSKKEKAIRDLLLLGERIRSHATHLYFLALPDYIGYGALTMAQNKTKEINDALALIRIGNKIVEAFGGREMHPFVKFTSTVNDFSELKKEIEEAKSIMDRTVKLFVELKYPKFERTVSHLCLKDEKIYAISSGNIVSEDENIKTNDYSSHLKENIKEYATSKFVMHDGKPYLVGSFVRINTNFDELNTKTKQIFKRYNIKLPFNNPFLNNIAQVIELYDSFFQVERLIETIDREKDEKRTVKFKDGRGVAAVEAPRGTLFHEYEIKDGKICFCNIITPTAQNLNQMEIDIKNYVQLLLGKKLDKEKMVMEIEKLIRAYDPCFSCSTHFLKVNWDEK